jgi:hypothetical protein
MARDKRKVVFYGPRKKKFGHHWTIKSRSTMTNTVYNAMKTAHIGNGGRRVLPEDIAYR